jgi:hypothetical protein
MVHRSTALERISTLIPSLDKTLHSVTPNFNNWLIAAKLDTFYLVPFLSTGICRVIKINWVADGKRLRVDLLCLPTDAVTMF